MARVPTHQRISALLKLKSNYTLRVDGHPCPGIKQCLGPQGSKTLAAISRVSFLSCQTTRISSELFDVLGHVFPSILHSAVDTVSACALQESRVLGVPELSHCSYVSLRVVLTRDEIVGQGRQNQELRVYVHARLKLVGECTP